MASLQNVTFEMNKEEINAMLQVILPAHFIPLLFIWLYISFFTKKTHTMYLSLPHPLPRFSAFWLAT